MKTWLNIVLINLAVLISILFVLSIPVYFYGVYKLESFFKFEEEHSNYYQPDSLAIFIHHPNVNIEFDWNEHEKQKVTFITNNFGFREDNDTKKEKTDGTSRILVTGDSHTDGVVFNEESFPNVMEEQLNSKSESNKFEVINGGTGFYSFKNYYGFIEKYKNLKPDYFIINVFTGNDFRETLLYEEESKSYGNIIKNGYFRAKRRLLLSPKLSAPLNQGLDQQYYFKTFPEDIHEALNYAQFYTSKIDSICEAEDIDLLITLLPTKTETSSEFREKVKLAYSWSDSTLNINSNLKESYREFLLSNGIEAIDLTDTLSNPAGKMFWDEDLHINTEAHHRIGIYLANKFMQNN